MLRQYIDEAHKDNNNWDHLWGIENTLLSDIVEENENEAKECVDEDVHDVEVDAKTILQSFMYSMIVWLYYFLLGNSHS